LSNYNVETLLLLFLGALELAHWDHDIVSR
jgi:hypothetical protein